MSHRLCYRIVSTSVLIVLLLGVYPQAIFAEPLSHGWNKSSRQLHSTKSAMQDMFATNHVVIGKTDGKVITVPVNSVDQIADTLAYWRKQPEVRYAEVDNKVRAYGQKTTWGYKTIQAAQALSSNGATGSGVVVAVIDSGVDYNHEDLVNNMWVNTGEIADNGIDDDGNGYADDVRGYDFIGDAPYNLIPDADPMDDAGHGTHVAGIIAAQNNTVGVLGVAPEVKIMPVKVLDFSGMGYDSTVASGIRYAVDNGANIINLSLGSSAPSTTMQSAVDYATANNVLVVAAAGNSGSFTKPSYPAAYAEVISVAASNSDGVREYYSNAGKIDVIAPGGAILSTTPGNTYTRYSGTSMAAPFVSGVAALISQKQSLTNGRAIRQVLQTTATDFGLQVGPDNISGYGMVNASAATGTLFGTTVVVYNDASWIKSDGSDDTVITAAVRDSSGNPVAGITVNWSTTKGTLSGASSTTNHNGLATITLTANATSGLAKITAQPTGVTAASVQVTIMTDVPQAEAVGVSEIVSYDTPTDDSNTNTTIDNIPSNVLDVGDNIAVWAQGTSYDRQEHNTVLTYAIKDAAGSTVLSGTSPTTTVGTDFSGVYFMPQTRIITKSVVIPETVTSGKYTLTVTLTDSDSKETSTRSTSLWIGDQPDILVVNYQPGTCFDTPVEGFDLGGIVMCTRSSHMIMDTLSQLGYEAMLWDTATLGSPTGSDLADFSTVVWLDSGLSYGDGASLKAYLDNGGNLLLSSSLLGGNEGFQSPTDSYFLWNYLHAHYVSLLIQPTQVVGTAGNSFAGLSFNTDYYDLNGNGSHNNFYANELELNSADGAKALLQYTIGDSADKVAALQVATDKYRLAYFSFNLAGINDASSGNATRSYIFSTIMPWLTGDGPVITDVAKRVFLNNKAQTLTITGTGFSTTGTTKVKLGKRFLADVVVSDRTTITATIPAGMHVGKQTLRIINPDGKRTVAQDVVTIQSGGIVLDAVTPTTITNDGEQWLVLTGDRFNKKTMVFLGKYPLTKIKHIGATEIRARVPNTVQPGKYVLRLKNPHSSKARRYHSIIVRLGITDVLELGKRSAQVKALEARLKKLGYFHGKTDDMFTEDTKHALMQYQHSLGLEVTGTTNYLTRHYLNNLETPVSNATSSTEAES